MPFQGPEPLWRRPLPNRPGGLSYLRARTNLNYLPGV